MTYETVAPLGANVNKGHYVTYMKRIILLLLNNFILLLEKSRVRKIIPTNVSFLVIFCNKRKLLSQESVA